MSIVAEHECPAGVLRRHNPVPSPRVIARLADRFFSSLVLQVATPDGIDHGGGPHADFLREVREFRAEVLYAKGRRPIFRTAEKKFVDADPLDLNAYHLVLRDADSPDIAGYVRLVPLDQVVGAVDQTLGRGEAARVLARYGVGRDQTLEVGRLVVAPGQRNSGLTPIFFGAILALARAHSRAVLWGISGMRDGQHLLYQRLGYQLLTGRVAHSVAYDDDLCLVVCDTRAEVPELDALAARLEATVCAASGTRFGCARGSRGAGVTRQPPQAGTWD